MLDRFARFLSFSIFRAVEGAGLSGSEMGEGTKWIPKPLESTWLFPSSAISTTFLGRLLSLCTPELLSEPLRRPFSGHPFRHSLIDRFPI